MVQDVELMKRKRATKEEKEAALVGRLDPPALRAIFEECLHMEQQQKNNVEGVKGRVDLSALARKYGANEDVLAETLRYCWMVPVERASDGRLIAKVVGKSSGDSSSSSPGHTSGGGGGGG